MDIFGNKLGDIDEGLMIGWFANAIMTGWDHAMRRHTAREQRIMGELKALSYHISHHCHTLPRKAVTPETPLEQALEDLAMRDRSLLSFVREHIARIEMGDVDLG